MLKDALTRDFTKLKMKVQSQEDINTKLEARFEVVKQELNERETSML